MAIDYSYNLKIHLTMYEWLVIHEDLANYSYSQKIAIISYLLLAAINLK